MKTKTQPVKTYQMTNDAFAATIDWFSRDRYNSPANVVGMLRRQGFADKAIIAVMQSKYTRWAADCKANPNTPATAKDLLRYLSEHNVMPGTRALRELLEETGDIPSVATEAQLKAALTDIIQLKRTGGMTVPARLAAAIGAAAKLVG
jgi:hypothetical protein